VSGNGKKSREGKIESFFSLSSLCSPCLCGEISWEEGTRGRGEREQGGVDWLMSNPFRPDAQEKKVAISYVKQRSLFILK